MINPSGTNNVIDYANTIDAPSVFNFPNPSSFFFLIFFRIVSIFNTHTGRGKNVLKELTVMYIQKGLTFGYT